MLEILDAFPAKYTPNAAQQHILSELSRAFELGKRFIIINAPTGTGKSFIAKTLANFSKDAPRDYVHDVKDMSVFSEEENGNRTYSPFGAAILTVTKALQDQYSKSFTDGSAAKGQSNYTCEIDEMMSCEMGVCKTDGGQLAKCIARKCCPYHNARKETALNKCAFYNYSMYAALPYALHQKNFLVCDEASELESELVNSNTVNITQTDLTYIVDTYGIAPPLSGSPMKTYRRWLSDIAASLKYTVDEMQYKFVLSSKKKKRIQKKEYDKFKNLSSLHLKIKRLLEVAAGTEYVITHTPTGIVLQPYNVDKIAQKMFTGAERVILLSATIVDPANFAKTLGIDNYYYIEAKTTMSPEKAKIYCTNDLRVNYKNRNEVMPKIAELVKSICENHANQKGIIHTHSMENLRFLETALKHSSNPKRFLYRSATSNNEQLIRQHENTSEPTVLVSPSMTHGVDLKGDLGEFQIIVKAPYMPMQDKRIKKKFDEDKAWYTNAMLSTLIQMSGRCNRNVDDVSVTYVLDANIFDAVRANLDKLPKYFIERFV